MERYEYYSIQLHSITECNYIYNIAIKKTEQFSSNSNTGY